MSLQPSRLTDSDRRTIAQARALAALPADANCEYTGEVDAGSARAVALGRAKHLLAELAAIAERVAAKAASPE